MSAPILRADTNDLGRDVLEWVLEHVDEQSDPVWVEHVARSLGEVLVTRILPDHWHALAAADVHAQARRARLELSRTDDE